jgi:hypothetical protein
MPFESDDFCIYQGLSDYLGLQSEQPMCSAQVCAKVESKSHKDNSRLWDSELSLAAASRHRPPSLLATRAQGRVSNSLTACRRGNSASSRDVPVLQVSAILVDVIDASDSCPHDRPASK